MGTTFLDKPSFSFSHRKCLLWLEKHMKSQMFSGKRWLCFASGIKWFQWYLGSFLWGKNTKSFMRSNSMSSKAQVVPSIQICLWSFVKSCSRICLELASLKPFLQAPLQALSSQVYYLNCELPQELSRFPFVWVVIPVLWFLQRWTV